MSVYFRVIRRVGGLEVLSLGTTYKQGVIRRVGGLEDKAP